MLQYHGENELVKRENKAKREMVLLVKGLLIALHRDAPFVWQELSADKYLNTFVQNSRLFCCGVILVIEDVEGWTVAHYCNLCVYWVFLRV